MNFVPRGITPGQTQTRFADVAPSSYDAKSRTVNCVISMGSPVVRFYGTEKLRISPDAVDLSRMQSSGIPLLDSHNQHSIENSLGRFTKTWFTRNALMGQITFNDTERGRLAEGMVARREIAGISAGYTVREWEITDAKGNVLDPEVQRINFEDDLTFEATRWSLLEGSLVTVPADSAAMVRSMGGSSDRQIVADVQARMLARHRISLRQAMYDDQAALDD
jgi:phage head maturation protease